MFVGFSQCFAMDKSIFFEDNAFDLKNIMFEFIVENLLLIADKMGYLGIFLLMTIESSFVPFPSEVVIPPAGYLAFLGKMNIYLVVLYGVLGSLLGASINYFLSLYLGRKVVYSLSRTKIAHLFLVNEEKVKKSEDYFKKYDKVSTFFGRLLPAIRQLISIPAGFTKMSFPIFVFYTSLGAGLWVVILALLGYFFGANQELLSLYYSDIKYFFIFLILVFVLVFAFKKRSKK